MFRKKAFSLIVLLGFSCLIGTSLFAQGKSAKATIVPEELLIGQQATLELGITTNKGSNVVFPQYPDTLITGVEVLKTYPTDTILSGNSVTYTQKYLVTSFDSASYAIPAMPVIDGSDTLVSNTLTLKVGTVALSDSTKAYIDQWAQNPQDSIDVAQLHITDIKPIQKPPFVWQDYLNYILWGLLILLILIALIVAIYMYRKKKKTGYFFKPEVIIPPHILALSALDTIKESKMWQQGREKEYYTDLTDILRKYIEGRFGTGAFEQTSDEILASMKNILETDSSRKSLEQVLKLSDLVKFAKYKPLLDENDLSLMNAYLFINQTKREEEPENPQANLGTLGKTSVKSKSGTKNKHQHQDNDDEEIDWTIPNDNNKPANK